MTRGANSSGKVTRAELDAQAMQYRKMGLTFKEIGEQMGTGAPAAFKRVNRILREARKKLFKEAAEYQMLEDERLDAALKAIWPNVVKGDHNAIGDLIKIMERRAKMLGLDGPIKIAHTDPTGDLPADENPTVTAILGRLTALAEGAGPGGGDKATR